MGTSMQPFPEHTEAGGALPARAEDDAIWYQAIQSSINGIALSGLDGNLSFVNRAFLRLWGYDAPGEVIGRHAAAFWETGALAAQVIAALGESGGWVGEMTARRRSGETFPVQLSATMIRDRGGNPVGMMGSFIDISARRHTELALQESEERYRLLFEGNPNPMWVYDLESLAFLAVNGAATAKYGYSREEFLGLTIADIRPPEDVSRLRENVARVTEGLDEAGHWRHRTKDGRVIDVEITSHTLVLAGRRAELVVAHDVTERLRAEADLVVAKRRLDFVMANSPAVIYTCRPSGDFGATFVTANIEEQLGYRAEELLADPGFWAAHLHPEDAPRVFRGLDQLFEMGSHTHEYRFRCRDGGWRWMHDELRLVRDPAGAPLEILGSWLDVTERRAANEERLELERRLLHAQKLESLGVLAGGIAHDFNNLLTAILGNLDLALVKLAVESPARANIEQGVQAARRATDLTRQLLAYSGRGSFIVRPLDVNELVQENVRLFRAAIARTTELILQPQRPLPPIEADAGQVQQVIMNLITNASDAIGDRPGVVTLTTGVEECAAPRLAHSRLETVPPPGTFVFLEVADTGAGMDTETQQRLFEPFFTTKKMGRGLGMSAILGIIRGHRGAVFVESAAGEGTRIRVLFPAAPTAHPERSGAGGGAGADSAPLPRGVVLVVDDDEDVLSVCRGMMEHLGFAVLTASGGRAAVALFEELAADIALVILDLSMPEMDGMAVLGEILRIRPDAAVILSSGYDRSETARRHRVAGIAGFVQKPYSTDQLRRAVLHALRGDAEAAGGLGSISSPSAASRSASGDGASGCSILDTPGGQW